MNSHATRTTRIMAIFCLMLLLVTAFVPSQVHAQSTAGVFEFPLNRSNPEYTRSMNIVLSNLGQGTGRWVLKANQTSYFNATVGCLEDYCGWGGEKYPVLYFDGARTPAPGACDIASYFAKVAERYGLHWDRTLKHVRALYGVEEQFWVSIWNPGQDFWVENKYDHDIAFVWSVEGGTLKIWMEGLDGEVILPQGQNLASAIASQPVDISGEFILDIPIGPTLQPVKSMIDLNWAPQNDIALTNARCPSIITNYVESTYPLGISIHHTVGYGGGDWFEAGVGAHCTEDRVPYGGEIGRDGVAHLTTEFGSRQNHAKCRSYGVVGDCANTDYFAIAVVGDYRTDQLTAEQEYALVNFIAWAIRQGANARVVGHRDIGKHYGYGTVCPGDNIYNRLPMLLEEANAGGVIQKMEGEFIIDPNDEYFQMYPIIDESAFGHEDPIPVEQLQPELVTVTPVTELPTAAEAKGVIWVVFAVASLIILAVFIIGGVMVILGVQSDRNRPSVTVVIGIVWLIVLCVIGGIGYYIYAKPPPEGTVSTPDPVPVLATPIQTVIVPTSESVDMVGTGGGIVMEEYVWEDFMVDQAYADGLTHPIVPYTSNKPLSRVFWYFAVGQLWGDQIPTWSAAYGLDPNLVATFMLIESGGNPLANCPGDKLGYDANTEGYKDKGLFQLNPKYFPNGCDFATNVSIGPQYIRTRMDAAGGNLAAAAAGYNGGPKALEWFLASSDPSSTTYQQKRAEYVTFLNGLGYNGASKATIVERYVKLVVGAYNAVSMDSTQGLETYLSPGSYAGSVAKAYGLTWPPVLSNP